MKKGYLVVNIILILIVSLSVFYCFNVSWIFEPAVSISMGKINIDGQNEIQVLYIQGNASSQNITQVRKINNKTKEKYILGNYERYNYLDEFYLDRDNLTIILRDTSIHHFTSVDTIRIDIQNVKYKISDKNNIRY